MKIRALMFHDLVKDLFFGYLIEFPAVCSQGYTKDEVMENLEKYFKDYLSLMGDQFEIKMEDQKIV